MFSEEKVALKLALPFVSFPENDDLVIKWNSQKYLEGEEPLCINSDKVRNMGENHIFGESDNERASRGKSDTSDTPKKVGVFLE